MTQPPPSSPAPFVAIVVGREVKHVTFATPDGPLEGYQLRFRLGTPQPQGPAIEAWTDWVHLPNPLMLQLTESLDAFMRTEGHLRNIVAGRPPQ